jgi:hypothetical protein
MLASTDLHSDGNDDDGFIDIDELLSGMQQKSVPASAASNSDDMSKMVDNRTRGGSPTDSSRSTAGSGRGEHTSFLNFGQDFLLIRSQIRLC